MRAACPQADGMDLALPGTLQPVPPASCPPLQASEAVQEHQGSEPWTAGTGDLDPQHASCHKREKRQHRGQTVLPMSPEHRGGGVGPAVTWTESDSPTSALRPGHPPADSDSPTPAPI